MGVIVFDVEYYPVVSYTFAGDARLLSSDEDEAHHGT